MCSVRELVEAFQQEVRTRVIAATVQKFLSKGPV